MTTIKDPVYFLLVDDLEENLLSLEALLRQEGLQLLKARSGEQALELLLKHEVALALLDVQMPGMDGFELAELMRGNSKTRQVPIIFLTAGGDDRQRKFRGYEAGAVDFIHKPIEADILKSKAKVFFELYQQRQLLAAQRDELKIAADALKEADRRKDEFIATLGHELRNPLAPIRTGLQILRKNPNSPRSDEVRDMMDRQMDHMVRLIDDLLDVSRISEGKIDLRKVDMTLQSAIQSSIETSKPVIDAAKHKLEVEVPKEDLWIRGDLTRVSQIISNVLTNAAKYTPEGGNIKLSLKRQDNEAIITVTDNGLGIPQEMLPKVFELFTQVDNHLERSQGGLGIGLALVRQLVEMHGGSISVASAGLNQGSTFTITLPVTKVEKSESEEEVVNTESNQKHLNVLVVDDNIPSAKTTMWMLEMIGHQASLAHDGREALEKAKAQNPDVILLDIGLPEMNGYEVCRKLREDAKFKDTVIIAQTGWGQESDKLKAKEAGFDHHLVKPVNLDQLSNLLSEV